MNIGDDKMESRGKWARHRRVCIRDIPRHARKVPAFTCQPMSGASFPLQHAVPHEGSYPLEPRWPRRGVQSSDDSERGRLRDWANGVL